MPRSSSSQDMTSLVNPAMSGSSNAFGFGVTASKLWLHAGHAASVVAWFLV